MTRHAVTGRLSTHVLDISCGTPAAGMRVELSVLEGGRWKAVKTVHTNADGRTDEPLLADGAMAAGQYRLVFHVGDYFRDRGVALADPPFLDRIPVRFGIHDPKTHLHVPLMCTPWGYSTYRGS